MASPSVHVSFAHSQRKTGSVIVVPNRSSSCAMFSLTSRNKTSLRAARCSQSVTTKHEVSRYRRGDTVRCDLTMATRVETRALAEGDRVLEVRAANDRIAEKAEELSFVSRLPMICEW